MQKRLWSQSLKALKVVAVALAVLGGAGACSRNTLYETADPDMNGQPPMRTVAATPAAYQTVQVQSQAYATPTGAPQPHGYAAPGDPAVGAAADPNATGDPNAQQAVPDPADLVGYETLSDGKQVKVVTYVHTYPEPIETYPRVYWSDRWYYNVNGNFVFYSPYYGGWAYYWGPPYPLVYAWNVYYPWAPYAWGYGYYGGGYYWGGAGYYGWHAYGVAPGYYQGGYYGNGGYNRPSQPSAGGPTGSTRHTQNAATGGASGGNRPFDDKRPGPAGTGTGGPSRPQGLASAPTGDGSRPSYGPGNMSAGTGTRRVAGEAAPSLSSAPGRGYTAPGTTSAFAASARPGSTGNGAAASYRPTYAPSSSMAYPSGGHRGSGGGSSPASSHRPTYTAGGSHSGGSSSSSGRSSYTPSVSSGSFRGQGGSYSGGSSSSFGGGGRGGGGGFSGGGGGGGGHRGGGGGFSGGGGHRGR